LRYAPFPELLQFFNSNLEVVFYEGVQHRLRFCLDHFNCVKMAVSSIGETDNSRKGAFQAIRVVVTFLVKNNPWWKRKFEPVLCHDTTVNSFVTKFGPKYHLKCVKMAVSSIGETNKSRRGPIQASRVRCHVSGKKKSMVKNDVWASVCHDATVNSLKNGVFWDVTPCGSCTN
jgi:hypothetical protein